MSLPSHIFWKSPRRVIYTSLIVLELTLLCDKISEAQPEI